MTEGYGLQESFIRAKAPYQKQPALLITVDCGISNITEVNIAKELAALRENGKQVVAYSEVLDTSAYLMAAQADEIYVHPSGAVAISGIGGYRDYTRELTENLKITIHNYSQGDYKSAVEGLTRNDMSDADRLQREEMYGPIWAALKNCAPWVNR